MGCIVIDQHKVVHYSGMEANDTMLALVFFVQITITIVWYSNMFSPIYSGVLIKLNHLIVIKHFFVDIF